MPKYEIEVKGARYEVESDHELTDNEILDYARRFEVPQIPQVSPPSLTTLEQPVSNVSNLNKVATEVKSPVPQAPLNIRPDQPIPENEKVFWTRPIDTALSLGQGLLEIPKTGLGLASLGPATVLPDSIKTPILDALRAGIAGFSDKQAQIQSLKSPQQIEAETRVDSAVDAGDTILKSVQNPSSIINTVTRSIPQMLVASGLAGKAINSAVAAGAVGEGVSSTGNQAASTLEEKGTLTRGDVGLSVLTGAASSGISLAGGKVANRMGFADVDTFAASLKPLAPAKKLPLIQKFVGGLATETTEEISQSSIEKIASNLMLGKKDIFEGVGKEAVLGGLSGAATGGGMQLVDSGMSRIQNIQNKNAKDSVIEPQQPVQEPTQKTQQTLPVQVPQAIADAVAKRLADAEKAKQAAQPVSKGAEPTVPGSKGANPASPQVVAPASPTPSGPTYTFPSNGKTAKILSIQDPGTGLFEVTIEGGSKIFVSPEALKTQVSGMDVSNLLGKQGAPTEPSPTATMPVEKAPTQVQPAQQPTPVAPAPVEPAKPEVPTTPPTQAMPQASAPVGTSAPRPSPALDTPAEPAAPQTAPSTQAVAPEPAPQAPQSEPPKRTLTNQQIFKYFSDIGSKASLAQIVEAQRSNKPHWQRLNDMAVKGLWEQGKLPEETTKTEEPKTETKTETKPVETPKTTSVADAFTKAEQEIKNPSLTPTLDSMLMQDNGGKLDKQARSEFIAAIAQGADISALGEETANIIRAEVQAEMQARTTSVGKVAKPETKGVATTPPVITPKPAEKVEAPKPVKKVKYEKREAGGRTWSVPPTAIDNHSVYTAEEEVDIRIAELNRKFPNFMHQARELRDGEYIIERSQLSKEERAKVKSTPETVEAETEQEAPKSALAQLNSVERLEAINRAKQNGTTMAQEAEKLLASRKGKAVGSDPDVYSYEDEDVSSKNYKKLRSAYDAADAAIKALEKIYGRIRSYEDLIAVLDGIVKQNPPDGLVQQNKVLKAFQAYRKAQKQYSSRVFDALYKGTKSEMSVTHLWGIITSPEGSVSPITLRLFKALSKIIGEKKVVLVNDIPGLNSYAYGVYDNGVIYLNKSELLAREKLAAVLLHEYIHAGTYDLIHGVETGILKDAKAIKLYSRLKEIADAYVAQFGIGQIDTKQDGSMDVAEFMADVFNEPEVQRNLGQLKIGHRIINGFKQIAQMISDYFGIAEEDFGPFKEFMSITRQIAQRQSDLGVAPTTTPIKFALDNSTANQMRQQGGFVLFPSQQVETTINKIKDFVKEQLLISAPRMMRVSEDLGNQAAKMGAARQAVPEIADYISSAALDNGADQFMVGAVIELDQLLSKYAGFKARGDEASANAVNFDGVFKNPQSPIKNFTDFENAMKDQKVLDAIKKFDSLASAELEEMYRSNAELDLKDPIGPENKGLLTGVYAPLAWINEEGPTSKGGAQKGSQLRRAPSTLQRTGSAEMYDVDFRGIVERAYRWSYENAAYRDLLKKMEENKVAVIKNQWEKDVTIDGEETVPYDLKRRQRLIVTKGGDTISAPETKILYVKKSVDPDFNKLVSPLTTGPDWWQKVANFSTMLKLKGLTEAVMHSINIGAKLYVTPEESLKLEMTSQLGGIPGVIATKLYQLGRIDLKSNEAKRIRAELARLGANRPHWGGSGTEAVGSHSYIQAGLQKLGVPERFAKFTDMSRNLEALDLRARIHAYKAFKEGVTRGWWKDSDSNLREFVNGLGQYNAALQSDTVRFLRGTGMNRFSTAATTFGIKTPWSLVATGLSPGAQAENLPGAIKGRMSVAGKLLGALITIAILNGALNKKEDGTPDWFPEDMPIGAVGIGDRYLDVLALTGWRRTLRSTGINALVEGKRRDIDADDILKRMSVDIAATPIATASGPPVQDISATLRGEPMTIKDLPEAAKAKPGIGGRISYAITHATPVAKAAGALLSGDPKGAIESQLPFIQTRDRSKFSKDAAEFADVRERMDWVFSTATTKYSDFGDRQRYIFKEIASLPADQRPDARRYYVKHIRRLRK
jgi:hypothetical protein